jgi:hypothetical protein
LTLIVACPGRDYARGADAPAVCRAHNEAGAAGSRRLGAGAGADVDVQAARVPGEAVNDLVPVRVPVAVPVERQARRALNRAGENRVRPS